MKRCILLFVFSSIGFFPKALMGVEQDNYAFVKNFELISAIVRKDKVVLKVKHPKTYGEAVFYFSPNAICKESFPPQCEGTVLRLDQGLDSGGMTTSTLEFKPERLYPYASPIFINIKGPRTTLRLEY